MIVPDFEKDPLRHRPYVWPSWLTKLMAGEERCWFKAWYKARHRYSKIEEGEDRAEFFRTWTAKHDLITERRAAELRADGWEVRVEDDAAFKLVGDKADVSGKPDLFAVKGDTAIVVDAKSGRKRDSDHWQVLIYLFALPIAWAKLAKLRLVGEVEYQDARVLVRALGALERDRIVAAIRVVTGARPPEASPSQNDCRYCDVARCPVRYKAPEGDASRYF
jgi:CRISPR/Cas system-associated exonuclease Cas4 (RecB family)